MDIVVLHPRWRGSPLLPWARVVNESRHPFPSGVQTSVIGLRLMLVGAFSFLIKENHIVIQMGLQHTVHSI